MAAKISVERLLEQEVNEINRAGEETYVKPLSFSEELTHFASKIDFYEGIDSIHSSDQINDAEEQQKENGKKKEEENDDNKWHWESVHSKLRIALAETCVMLDVLQNLNKKKYLVLDPIQQNAEPEKQTVQMLEKRKLLARAGAIIAKGAVSLKEKEDLSEPIIVEENDNKYYIQLMQLRQYWRVKKAGTQITGDVSYRSVGSNFWHPGLFEVKPDRTGASEKTLMVNVSSDLAQPSELSVTIIDENPNHCWQLNTSLVPKCNKLSENEWENLLKMAQQHLLNKEIFFHLSNDAFQGSFSGVDVFNSQITCKILEDATAIVSLKVGEHNEKNVTPSNATGEFRLLLTRLLLKQHKLNAVWTTPYPSTSSYYRKQSKSSTIFNVLHRSQKVRHSSILSDFLAAAKHTVWVDRLKYYLNEKVKSTNDASIVLHWITGTNQLSSAVVMSILTKLDGSIVVRNSLWISIDPDRLHIILEDASKIELPLNLTALDAVLKLKIQKHLLNVGKALCVRYGWCVISCTGVNCIIQNDLNTAFPENRLICYSAVTNRTLSINLTDVDNVVIEVTVSRMPAFLDDAFKQLNGNFEKMNWNLIPGKSFVEKLQALFLAR